MLKSHCIIHKIVSVLLHKIVSDFHKTFSVVFLVEDKKRERDEDDNCGMLEKRRKEF
jgi:hypothetical protein